MLPNDDAQFLLDMAFVWEGYAKQATENGEDHITISNKLVGAIVERLREIAPKLRQSKPIKFREFL